MISSSRPPCNYPLDLTETLRNWANSSQAEKDLETVFGQALHWPTAYRHLDAFRRGDFSLLPPVEVLEDAAMPGLWGGYSRDLRMVFLSEHCPADLKTAVLLDEIGHFLDQELCAEETLGEEGTRFAALVLNLPVGSDIDDDSLAPISFEGRDLLVEAARKKAKPKKRGSAKSKSSKQKSGKKKRGSSVVVGGNDGAGYAEVGSRSSNPKLMENIIYATEDAVIIPQKAAGDRLIGSRGNDTFVVLSQDVRVEDPNGGTDTVESSVTFSLANHSVIENLVLTGGANINGTGNLKANAISGNSGNNKLDGGTDSAIDTLIGGAGNDTYVLRDTLDQVVEAAGGGIDTIETTQASFSMANYANVENLAYSGTGTGVALTGNSGSNTITGTAGADSLDGGAGSDSLIGGAGNDTYFVDDSSDSIYEESGNGTDLVISAAASYSLYSLGNNVENIILNGSSNISASGNSLNNSLTGNSGNNSLDGGDGNDTIIGGGGSDTFIGGDGNDLYIVKGNVTISATGSDGTDTVWAYANQTLSSGVEVLQLFDVDPSLVPIYDSTTDIADSALSSTTEIFTNGVAINSEIEAKSGLGDDDWVKVNLVAGNTYQFNMKGSSTNRGTLGQCRMELYANTSFTTAVATDAGGEGSDDLFNYTPTYSGYHYIKTFSNNSGTGTYELTVNLTAVGPNNLLSGVGSTDNNTLIGSAARNSLSGMGGGDSLYGGDGVDTLIGGAGNDSYFNDGSDLIIENAGEGNADYVESATTYTLAANLEVLRLTGSDTISGIGNAGNNTISGNASANSLNGGAGNDSLIGGAGNDTYFVDSSSDVIVEAANEGTDLVISTVSHSLGNNLENLTYAGLTRASLLGNNLDNIINGSSGGINTLEGGTGNDTLIVHGRRIGNIDGGADTDWLRLTGDLLAFRNPSFTNIEVLDLSLLSGSASVTLDSAAAGLGTLVASSFNDTIDASAYTASILIDASAGSGSRLIGATGVGLVNTLIGGANGGNEFVLDAIGTNSLVGGFGGLDTLTLTNGGVLLDSAFTPISGIGILKLEGSANTFTLGANALIAGIRTLVGGEGNDLGTGNSINTSAYGSAGVLFQVTDQDYLANITTLVGGTGVDTLKFSRDGVSVTDENVDNLTDIDVIQTANGTNRFLMHDAFYLAGIDSIIGGTGTNIIDMSHPDYDPLNRTTFDDAITFDMSAGSYSLLVNDSELRYAKVVGGSPGGSVSILDDIGIVTDIMFSNLYDAKISSVSYSGATIILGENAMATGMSILNINDTEADVRDFNAPLVINGVGNERVFTSFAALADLTFNGGNGSDTLEIEGSNARAITSLKGDFEFLVLDAGNNFVRLGNDAGLSVIVGGTGSDTLDFLANTTGINFVMNASLMGDTVDDALITGGIGSDMLTIEFGLTTGNTFQDIQFSRTFLQQNSGDTRNGFTTDTSDISGVIVGRNYYIFDAIFDATGISRIFAHNGDTLDAGGAWDGVGGAGGASGPLNFAFGSVSDFKTSTIIGTALNDTLTLNSTTVGPETIGDTDFGPHVASVTGLKTFIETLVLNSLQPTQHADFRVDLGTNARDAGIRTAVGGNGSDSLDASAMNVAVTLSGGVNVLFGGETPADVRDTLVGGSVNDSLYGDNFNDSLVGGIGADTLNGTSSTAKGANEIDTLTGGSGNDLFVLGDASNAYYNTAERKGDYAIITDFTVGDVIQLRDLSVAYGRAEDPAVPGSAFNISGYLLGSGGTDNIYSVSNSNSWLYVDINKSGAIDSGDNLVAAIQDVAGGLVKADLLTNKFDIV
jgi:Ca2+-binding RTX toxin-like protein